MSPQGAPRVIAVPDYFADITQLGPATAIYRRERRRDLVVLFSVTTLLSLGIGPGIIGIVTGYSALAPLLPIGAVSSILAVISGLNLFFRWRSVHTVVLYAGGFAFRRAGVRQVVGYHEITSITGGLRWRSTGRGHYQTRYEVTDVRGTRVVFDDSLENIDRFMMEVFDKDTAHRAPIIAQRYATGAELSFGPITVQNAVGMKVHGKVLPWQSIIEIKHKLEDFTVRTRNDHEVRLRSRNIPDVRLLCRLLGIA